MKNTIEFIDANNDSFLSELKDFLRFPSVSTREKNNQDVENCANWLAKNMVESGLKNVEIIKTKGHPLIYADNLDAGQDKPTVLIYGHYDVQPEDPIDLWDSPPFEPVVKDGKIYGRGTADDKGQVFTHIKAVQSLMKAEGKLPVNVKFIIEGEEESGSYAIEEFLNTQAEKLACDVVLISDTSWFAPGLPTITYALRGIAVVEITVKGPNRDLHSGSYGGATPNPINILCKMLATLHDDNNKITIENYYNDVLELTDEERESFQKLPFDLNRYKSEIGINDIYGEEGFSTLERQWARPTIDINGIYGGYTDQGHKSIIPSWASAKISMRIVNNQDWKKSVEAIKAHLIKVAPPAVTVEFKGEHGGNPAIAPIDGESVKAAAQALKNAFGVDAAFMREGGSIPIVTNFQENLNAPAILMGFGLDSDNIHSPNENFLLENFFGGIKASAYFLDEMSKISK